MYIYIFFFFKGNLYMWRFTTPLSPAWTLGKVYLESSGIALVSALASIPTNQGKTLVFNTLQCTENSQELKKKKKK